MLEKLLDKYKTNSKVERVTDDNTRYGISAMRIIAKSTLTFKTLARDLRGLNNAFSKYLKLHNVQPTEGEKLGDLKKSLSQHDDIKVARVKATKERREKPVKIEKIVKREETIKEEELIKRDDKHYSIKNGRKYSININ